MGINCRIDEQHFERFMMKSIKALVVSLFFLKNFSII